MLAAGTISASLQLQGNSRIIMNFPRDIYMYIYTAILPRGIEAAQEGMHR